MNEQEPVLFECTVTITAEEEKIFFREMSFLSSLNKRTYLGLILISIPAVYSFLLGGKFLYFSVSYATIFLIALWGMIKAWFISPKELTKKNIENRLLPIEHTLVFRDNSYTHISKNAIAEGNTIFSYEHISEARETKRSFYIVRVDNRVHDLPKNQLTTEQADWIRGFFAHKFGAKFKKK